MNMTVRRTGPAGNASRSRDRPGAPTGNKYGKRIGARRASRHKPKNHDRFRKSFRFVRFRRGSRPGPAGEGILHVIPQSPEKPRKTNPGLPAERGQDDLRIRRRRQQNESKTKRSPASRSPPDLAAITFALSNLDPQRWCAKIRCRHGQSSGQRHCGRRPSRPVGTVRTERSVKFRDCRNSDEPVVPVRNLLRVRPNPTPVKWKPPP